MVTRTQATKLLMAMPKKNQVSTELCCDVNPELWFAWCSIDNRPPARSEVWTEYDVASSCYLIVSTHMHDIFND
jgi:hypothetical protein